MAYVQIRHVLFLRRVNCYPALLCCSLLGSFLLDVSYKKKTILWYTPAPCVIINQSQRGAVSSDPIVTKRDYNTHSSQWKVGENETRQFGMKTMSVGQNHCERHEYQEVY